MAGHGTDETSERSYPRPDVPRLSLGERDRRWTRVRALMADRGVDAIVAPHNSSAWDQGNGNGRYLSSIGGNCAWASVVFPSSGDVTVVTGPVPHTDYWLEFQDWVTDIRPAFFSAAELIVDRLRELGLAGARIGLAGLEGVARAPEGLVSHGTYLALQQGLPGAQLVDATRLLYDARVVKSDEEVAFLERGVALAERAVEVMAAEAKAGVAECVVSARMAAAMLERGGEPSSLLLWAAGNPVPPAVAMMASQRPLETGDVISVEVDGKWGGYLGHVAQTLRVGGPDAVDREMAEVQFEASRRCWNALRPGSRLGDFVTICQDAAAGSPYRCEPILHSRGLGFDAPVLVFEARNEQTKNWSIEAGSVFAVKPRVSTADGARAVLWGDSVVATVDGGRRLGSQPPLLWTDAR